MASVIVGLGLSIVVVSSLADAVEAADARADRVVVMYFHRTQRCPTCLKMGGYTKEAVTKGFAQEIADGMVEFHFIDFQDKKNAALTKGYQVAGPTLIVAKLVDNKVAQQKDLKEIWSKAADKEELVRYVREAVKESLK